LKINNKKYFLDWTGKTTRMYQNFSRALDNSLKISKTFIAGIFAFIVFIIHTHFVAGPNKEHY